MKFILQQERLTLFFDSFQANEKLKFTKYRISRKKCIGRTRQNKLKDIMIERSMPSREKQ